MKITQPEPTLVLVAISPRLVLRVALAAGVTFAGWFLDEAPVSDPAPAAKA